MLVNSQIKICFLIEGTQPVFYFCRIKHINVTFVVQKLNPKPLSKSKSNSKISIFRLRQSKVRLRLSLRQSKVRLRQSKVRLRQSNLD